MKMLRNYTRTALATGICLLAGASLVWAATLDITDTITRTFAVDPQGTAYIEMDHGTVDITSYRGSEVEVIVERTVDVDDQEKARKIFEQHDLEIRESGGDVYLNSEFGSSSGFWKWFGGSGSDDNVDVRVRVRVPRSYNLNFEVGAGNATVAGVHGRIEGETGAGNITVRQSRGEVDVSSGAGNVTLSEVGGDLQAATGAGNVTAEITRPLSDNSSLASGMGNVSVRLSSDVGVDVDASTGMGSIATDFELDEDAAFMSGSASGAVNGGGATLELSTGMGAISILNM